MAFLSDQYRGLAPAFAVEVGGTEIGRGITDYVNQVVFESADGMADMVKLSVSNPNFDVADAKVFQPGNELSLWLGYGTRLEHVARVVLMRPRITFPPGGMPTLEVKGYTKDVLMMDNAPEEGAKRAFKSKRYSDAVTQRGGDYARMELDVDQTPEEPRFFIQKVGLSDYDFIKGLSNLTGFYFWVDGDENGVWTLHFKDPDLPFVQENVYTFIYNDQNRSTLLEFEPEALISGASTKMKVQFKDPVTGRILKAEFNATDDAPEIDAAGDVAAEVLSEFTTGGAVKLYFKDYSFTVLSDRSFANSGDLQNFAQAWFARMNQEFVLGRGRVVGEPTLLARQTHTLENVGTLYSGDYFFSRVRHVLSEGGYICEFDARKMVA